MRKLLLKCSCKQEIQVPRSALGTIGVCPSCGNRLEITAHTTRPLPKQHDKSKRDWKIHSGNGGAEAPEDARQRFGHAVDLYYAKRHAEALAVFDSLLKEYPGNPDIQAGREQCLIAMKRPALSAPNPTHLLEQTEITEETIRRIVLDKLLNAQSEAVQIHAAELAIKLLDMEKKAEPIQDSAKDPETTIENPPEPTIETPSETNGREARPPAGIHDIFDESLESDLPAPIE